MTTYKEKFTQKIEDASSYALKYLRQQNQNLIEKTTKLEEALKISKSHIKYSALLDCNPEVLTNPKKFLGEDYRMILDFWLRLDELTEEQKNQLDEYNKNGYNKSVSKTMIANDSARNYVGAAELKTIQSAVGQFYGFFAQVVTAELIGMRSILAKGMTLIYSEEFYEMFP